MFSDFYHEIKTSAGYCHTLQVRLLMLRLDWTDSRNKKHRENRGKP